MTALNLQIGMNFRGSSEGGRVKRKWKQYGYADYRSVYLRFRLAVIAERTGLLVGGIHF